MSRRDFFARVAGRAEPQGAPSPDPPLEETEASEPVPGDLHTFHVAAFPFHDGPVLVPILRVGDIYRLGPEPPYSREPTGLRIERGKDLLGYVPDDLVPELLQRIRDGEPLICRAVGVDPYGELSLVLRVAIALPVSDPETEGEVLAEGPEPEAEPEMKGEPAADPDAGDGDHIQPGGTGE